MNLKTTILCTTIAMTYLLSCKKSDHHEEISALTSITINAPYENQAVKNGDTITINASIKSPSEIHGYDVFIIKNNNDTLFSADEHLHAKSITVNKFWINNLTSATDLQLVIVATVDHDGNTISKSRVLKTTI
jgi:hypothetical protein